MLCQRLRYCSCSTGQHLGRVLEDDPEARELFRRAEENRTRDGFITFMEMEDIFEDFDVDGNDCFKVSVPSHCL